MKTPPKRVHSEEAKARAKQRRKERAARKSEIEQQRGAPTGQGAKRASQPATLYRLLRFIQKSGVLAGIVDSRASHLIKFSAETLLLVLIFGLLTAQTSMRSIEELTTHFSARVRASIGLQHRRVSDTTLYDFLKLLEPSDLNNALVRFAKAMWSMGKLKPRGVPFSVAAFDGKNTQTIKFNTAFKELNKARKQRGLPPVPDTFLRDPYAYKEELRQYFAESLPMVQLVFPTKETTKDARKKARKKAKKSMMKPHGLIRSHRMTLVSSDAQVTLFNEFIPGSTNEVGHAPGFLRRALEAFRRTKIARVIVADAGNSSREISEVIREMGSHYVLAIKENQPDAIFQAHRLLGNGHNRFREPDYIVEDNVNSGKEDEQLRQRHEIWVTNAEGLLENFPSAAQIIRVSRTVQRPNGEIEIGNRFFVTSIPASKLTPKHAAIVIRMYWRCENGGHWPSDLIWREDTSRSPIARSPLMLEVLTTLRLLAQSMVAVLRSMTRRGYDNSTPISWASVIENIRRVAHGAVRTRFTTEVLVGV